jgi:hypothetical protein
MYESSALPLPTLRRTDDLFQNRTLSADNEIETESRYDSCCWSDIVDCRTMSTFSVAIPGNVFTFRFSPTGHANVHLLNGHLIVF